MLAMTKVIKTLQAVTIAWACLKLYDEPARRWLADKLLRSRA